MNKRIFFALNFSLELKKEITKKYSKKLDLKGIKKVKKENIHATLLFLGNFTGKKIKEIKEKIKKIKQKKIKAKIKGIDSFNSKIIFLKITKGKKEIKELHEKICKKLEVKDMRFKAHITIARNKKVNKKKFKKIMKKLKEIEFEKEIEIKSFELMESILFQSNPEYKKIYSFELNL